MRTPATTPFLTSLHQRWARNLRAARGDVWSQRTLAKAAGLSVSHVNSLERGKRRFTVEVMVTLAGVLQRPVGELFPWPKSKPPFPTGREAA